MGMFLWDRIGSFGTSRRQIKSLWIYTNFGKQLTTMPWTHKKFNHRRYFFQQDNAPIHTAKDTKDWMSQKQVKVLSKWLAQSPDRESMGRRVWKRNLRPANKHKLYVALKEEWETIPRKTYYYKKLIDSMPRRVHECIERCGGEGPTSY